MAEKFNNVGLWDITFYRLDDEGNPYKKNGKVVLYDTDSDFADTLDWVQLELFEGVGSFSSINNLSDYREFKHHSGKSTVLHRFR